MNYFYIDPIIVPRFENRESVPISADLANVDTEAYYVGIGELGMLQMFEVNDVFERTASEIITFTKNLKQLQF